MDHLSIASYRCLIGSRSGEPDGQLTPYTRASQTSPEAGFLCASMHEPAEAIRNDVPGLQPGLCWWFMSPGAMCSPGMCFQLRSRVSMATLAALQTYSYTTECSQHASLSRAAHDRDQDYSFFLRLVLRDADRCRPGTSTLNSVVQCIRYSISGNKEFALLLCVAASSQVIFTLWNVLIFSHSNKETRVSNTFCLCYNRLLVLIVLERMVLLLYVLGAQVGSGSDV